jgi:hypothetical protein
MSDWFLEMRSRGNRAVAYALRDARAAFHEGRLDDYRHGNVFGQILVAHCDLCADTYLVDGACNEINFLRWEGRKARP